MTIWLAAAIIVIGLCNVALLIALTFLIVSVKKLLDKQVASTVGEVQATLREVHTLVDTVENKAQRIMDVSEETVRKVSGRVVATTDLVQETITSPLISLSSTVAGLLKAFQVLRQDQGAAKP